MSRHKDSNHLIKSGDTTKGFAVWCGTKLKFPNSEYGLQRYASLDICSKCSAKYYAAQIAEHPFELSERIDISGDGRRYTWKSIYHIIRREDRATVGFVAIKLGWGKSWDVFPWSAKDSSEPKMGTDSVKYRHHADDRIEYGSIFASKEHALTEVPKMAAQGKLPTFDEVKAQIDAEAAAYKQRVDALDAQMARTKKERAEQDALIKAEFEGFLTGDLTNAQREALFAAARRLGIALNETPAAAAA